MAKGRAHVVARYAPPSSVASALNAAVWSRTASVEGKVSACGFVKAGKPTSGTAATKTLLPRLGHENPLLKASVRGDPFRNPG